MAFSDFTKFMQPALALPYNSKVYTIPKPDLDTGLRLTHAFDGENGDLFDAPIEEQWAIVLGTAYDAMKADKVPVEFVSRAFLTALADFQGGRDLAEATWEVGTDPEAVATWLRAKYPERQVAPTTEEPASTSTDAETSTP